MFNQNNVWILLLILVSIFSSCSKEKIKPNILLITIDTLRRDHLGAYGYPRETSPFIDKLARNGIMFKHVITPQPQTSGSHASILTSLHPLTHGVIFNGLSLDCNVQTIAEVFKKNGYYTIGAVAIKILRKRKNFSQGFDSFSDQWEKEKLTKIIGKHQRTAQSVNDSMFKQIQKYYSSHKKKPLFLWVHYYDPHKPYIGREWITFKNKLPDRRETDEKIKKYDQEIRYTDDAIRKLYTFLEEKSNTRPLVTCITADHGEQLADHGSRYGHNDFYSETTLVPLIFHGYGIPRDKIIGTYVSVMDIAVTLLARANLTFDYSAEGIDLLSPDPRWQKVSRKFLIIGTQRWTRSLQLIGNPFAYILNLDHHSKYWNISTLKGSNNHIQINENRFKPIHEDNIKQDGNKINIALPRFSGKGLNYVVLKVEFEGKKNKNVSVVVKMEAFPNVFNKPIKVQIQPLDQSKMNHQILEVVYPVTIVDRLNVHLTLKGTTATSLNNVRYAFISVREFPEKKGKIVNLIWGILLTPRRYFVKDELFDLSGDIKMQKNLLDMNIERLKPTIEEYKNLIYATYKYYREKKNKVLQSNKARKKITEEEKKMLKSLGYL